MFNSEYEFRLPLDYASKLSYFEDLYSKTQESNRAQLLKNMSMDDVKDILSKEPNTKSKPVMLLSTVNCSIGNKKKHFTLTSLKNLFYKKEPLDVYDKYALKTIKNEALEEEIVDFRNYYRISPKRVETVLASL